MKCSEFKEFLSAYANNELSSIQRGLVEEHLSGCIDCRAKLEDYRVVRQQMESLKTIPAMPDIRDTTMSKVKAINKSRLVTSWIRPALIAFPVIAILITLFVLQPWNFSSSPQAVIAKSIDATDSIMTYRVNISPFITLPFSDKEVNFDAEWEFVFPDRTHLKLTRDGQVAESIYIGDLQYYRQDTGIMVSGIPLIDAPNKENSLKELQRISGLEQLPDDFIDGIECFHFKGIDSERADITIELWVGKEDYFLRQRISQIKMPDGTINTSVRKYYDFNQPISIEAPVTSSGELLDGWQVVDMASSSEPGQTPVETGNTTTTGTTTTTRP